MTTPIADLFPGLEPDPNLNPVNEQVKVDSNNYLTQNVPMNQNNFPQPIPPVSNFYPLSNNMANVVNNIKNKSEDNKEKIEQKKAKNDNDNQNQSFSVMIYIYVFITSLIAFNPWMFRMVILILTNQKLKITLTQVAITLIGSLLNTLLFFAFNQFYPIQLN